MFISFSFELITSTTDVSRVILQGRALDSMFKFEAALIKAIL